MSEPATDSIDDLLRAVASAPARPAPLSETSRGETELAPPSAPAAAHPEGSAARIDRALAEERIVNAGRLAVINVVVVGLALTYYLVRDHSLYIPLTALWFVISAGRVGIVWLRPSARRWVGYSFIFVDAPLALGNQYRAFETSANPLALAAFTLCAVVMIVAAIQYVLSPRRMLAVAAVLLVATSVLFARAGRWQQIAVCTIFVGGMSAVAIYGQNRTKALLRRIVAETDARAREAELANVELRRQVAERSRLLSEALAGLATAQPAARIATGEVIEDRYRIVRHLGAGGMGVVYEVERLGDGRRLALKTMTGVVHREALARFAREAQIAAELDAPNLVAALDVGVTKSGTLFLVMELVAGASLATSRERYGDARWAVPILAQVARALAAMHERGIVHRDLKPSNILFDGTSVKVADFGIAGLVGDDPLAATIAAGDLVASPELTRTGAILGTPLYMAPELVRGARAAGPPADMFSFGVVAYQLLAGKLPHAAPPVLEKLAGRAMPGWTPLANVKPELPAELCALVDACLGESADARPTAASAVAMLAAGHGASAR